MKSSGIAGSKAFWLGLAAVVVIAAYSIAPASWFGPEVEAEVRGAKVRRGPLRITVLQRGELSAKNSTSIKSEIEGQTTILQLVTEGTVVQPGDLLVRLDSSDLVEKELQQRISSDNADAAYKKAKAQHDIQVSQNQSDIEAAERRLQFAEMDLNKYKEGDLEQLRKEAEDRILLARQKRTQAENTLTWSKTLHEKGFLTQTELDRDDLEFQSADVQLEQADLALELLKKFDDPRRQSELEADLKESRRGLDRARLEADARIADFQAALTTSEARWQLEKEKLAKYRDQLEKTRITAPVAGMVVYTRTEGGRMGGGETIQEGSQVREGQEMLTIPSTGGMIAEASIHESVLNQVAIDLPCAITVDAIPTQQFKGKVRFVAPLPDKGNWWANPNQRLYRTEVSIEDASPEMRPGMNCSIEILVEEIADAIYAPLQAIVLSKGKPIAFVTQGSRVEERSVVVGKQSDKWVQILEGLAEDEEVLLTPPAGFTPQKQETEGAKPADPRGGDSASGAGRRAGAANNAGSQPSAESGSGGVPGAGRGGRGQRPPGAVRPAQGSEGAPATTQGPAKQDSASPGGAQSSKP
ncbi:MAG: efflux RND transporter periplasmic adaptor subunit [Planctomycetota bacterium]